jgi:4-hydroxy-2-oxoheptanedioate aldolase
VLARLGFDWLTLDIEHSAIDWSQAAMIFAAIADAGCVPLARVPEGSHHYIKRVLDAGAWGHRRADGRHGRAAKAAIAAAKYPPEGNRSVGGGMHSMNFDATAGEYYERANDEILVVLQTESPGRGERRGDLQPARRRCDLHRPQRPALPDACARRHVSHAEQHEAMVQRVIEVGKQRSRPHRHPRHGPRLGPDARRARACSSSPSAATSA